ncbi:MAG: aminoacyl-tRNA hydrolase [Phycisphaerales bacterium]|jgi:PTH1 family peptidyl-tRNA hydrolase|nr:aminoacyl-tRNA hydrolase [Phycisphaerales bacterium]
MKLVVGLGNPGSQYAGTRHNIGWEVLDHLARRLRWIGGGDDFNRVARSKFSGLAMDGTVESGGQSDKLLLLKPTTYMNNSGQSVQAAAAFYQLSPADLMVVLDDLALPCGKIRLRAGGSSGGHNGLRDIERALGTNQYPRLRIGIDPAPNRVPGRDYVLGRFTEDQRTRVDPAVERSAAAIELWLKNGIAAAMNRFNADADEKEE